MKRREFIVLTGAGATSATLLSACGHPEEKLIPVLIPDGEYVPGIDNWKASTCGMCPAGCGIVVRTRDHKANKIEGNPLHPVNRGALCARGQAGLEVLYNPDRIKGPMKRIGERGEGKWQEISWEEAIKTLADKLREIDPSSPTNKVQFFTADADGITAHVAGRLMQVYRQGFVAGERNGRELPGVYADLISGVVKLGAVIPDIANSTYLVSFGARFLETWKSPVMYSQAYGQFRRASGRIRGRFVHVEPRLSLTAANADEWVAAAPGTEAIVALAMVQLIVREGLNKAIVSSDAARELEEFSPERSASTIGVPAERIIRLAREFAWAERPLAIGDLRAPADSAISLLNAMVENLNRPGGVRLVESDDNSTAALEIPGGGLLLPGESDEQHEKSKARDSVELISRFFQTAAPPYRMLMIHGFNPIFGMPGWREELGAIPFIVSFSSVMDETSEMADLLMPDHSYLERWDLRHCYGPDGSKILSLTQPVLDPQLNTQQTADVLLAVARELGGEASEALPLHSSRDIVEKTTLDRATEDDGESAGAGWNKLMETGVITRRLPGSPVSPQASKEPPVSLNPFFLGMIRRSVSDDAKNEEFPLTLIGYEHAAFGDGFAAHLPSIQELPDPMTSVMWGSWVEINPQTATALQIADGDLVAVATAQGSMHAPALLYPGIRPDCIAIPLGQGHSSYGRYAQNRGINPTALFPTSERKPVPANVTRIGGNAELIRFGTGLSEKMERRR